MEKNFENMTGREYEYSRYINGHSEIALYVDTFEEVDTEYNKEVANEVIDILSLFEPKVIVIPK